MYEIILAMINEAERTQNYILIDNIKKLIERFAYCNCPISWRSVGEQLAHDYQYNQWVYDNLELYEHEV